jgi:non-homologous end joining protein Ku
VRPYHIVRHGKVGHDAYAVSRETIRSLDLVAIAHVVLTSREHVIALEARDNGLMGMLPRYPYEVRDAGKYCDEIQDVKITEDMLDLARHMIDPRLDTSIRPSSRTATRRLYKSCSTKNRRASRFPHRGGLRPATCSI